MVAYLGFVEYMAAVEDPRMDRTKARELFDLMGMLSSAWHPSCAVAQMALYERMALSPDHSAKRGNIIAPIGRLGNGDVITTEQVLC